MIKHYADPPLPGYLPLPIPKEEEPYITLVKNGVRRDGTLQATWVVELPEPQPANPK